MENFIPKKILYEKRILDYPLGKELFARYHSMGIPMTEIASHHNVPFVKEAPDEQFLHFKKYLVLGIRKSLSLTPNTRSADYIVPFTSSGCPAMCTYCYLVCTFFKGSYLRIFVNREDMVEAVRRKARNVGVSKVYEIGSNSDMVLENIITGNLRWAIEKLSQIENVQVTFATKFSMVDDLLDAKHGRKVQMRISVNPDLIIKKIEIGTSSLEKRVAAANKMFHAGYTIGINVAPIILLEDWKTLYTVLFDFLYENLDKQLQEQMFFELIFMTFGLANEKINAAALPNVVNVFDRTIMRPKGRGKYCYKPGLYEEASCFFRSLISEYFPSATISYVV